MEFTSEARKALERALKQLHRVQVSATDPPDHVEAVTFAFYAYENGVVALAEARKIRWAKNHARKAELAGRLFTDGVVPMDVQDRLAELNELRKDVAYGEPGPELMALDLEDLAVELETFLDEVAKVVDAADPKP